MIDLAARVHYKAHFDIVGVDDNVDTFVEIIEIIKVWISVRYAQTTRHWNWNQFQRFGFFNTDDRGLFAKSTSYVDKNNYKYWACKIEEMPTSIQKEDNAAGMIEMVPRIWTTEIGYEQKTKDRATISFIVYYIDKAGFIGVTDDEPSSSTPNIITSIMFNQHLRCYIGRHQIFGKPLPVKNGEGDSFVKLLYSHDRNVPIVLMMPHINDVGKSIHDVNPSEFMRNVIGNAIVYYALDSSLSEELSYLINKQYWCLPGYIRMYMPGMQKENITDGFRHRYISANQVNIIGGCDIIRIFRRVLSQDIKYYESNEMFRIEDCDNLFRINRFSELRVKYESEKESAEQARTTRQEFEALFDDSENDNKELRTKISNLEDGNSELKSENWRLRSHNEQLKHYQTEITSMERALKNVRTINKQPKTAIEIASYFRSVFHDKLDFSDRGLRSLQDCITKPEILWDCFYSMANFLTDLYRNNTPNIEKEFKTASGWDMARGEGSETRKDGRLMNLRKDVYQGRDIFIEPHVRCGTDDHSDNSVRVYFAYDEQTLKIIIGHVGSHLDNYTTRTI